MKLRGILRPKSVRRTLVIGLMYGPDPGAFSVVQKPWGWAHILVQKPQGARGGGGGGGMVTSQIDTCITAMFDSLPD